MSQFVQLRHPWEEHRPRGELMPLNQGTHRRKFLISPGHYVEDLALETRVLGDPMAAAAARRGISRDAGFERRRRAEARLARVSDRLLAGVVGARVGERRTRVHGVSGRRATYCDARPQRSPSRRSGQ